MRLTLNDCYTILDNWGFEKTAKGYDIFVADGDQDIINAEQIQRIDEVERFDGDLSACEQAEKDGIQLIYGMDGVEDGRYIDTPENRETIHDSLRKYGSPKASLR